MYAELIGLREVVIAALIYCVPWGVAWLRRHHNCMAIGVLNLVAGWTVLGWMIALVWACTEVHRHHTPKHPYTYDAGEPTDAALDAVAHTLVP